MGADPPGTVKVGYVSRAHGIKGAVIVRDLGDEGAQFAPGRELISDGAGIPVLTVAAAHPHKDGILVLFEQVTDRNQAEGLRGVSLYVDIAERRGLEADEYWPEQLIGLAVISIDGIPLGEVIDLIAGSVQDRLVVATADGDREVPFVAAIVTSVDIEGGRVVVDPPRGLLSE